MDDLLSPAHLLLTKLLLQLSTSYQKENFQAMLASRLACDAKTLASNHWKSAAALSRFLSQNRWSLGPLVTMIRGYLLAQLLTPQPPGRRPDLHVMLDLTSFAKEGKFDQFRHWLHYFHGCFGLHVVVLYLCCGRHRVPWSLAIFRGKGRTSPAQLALRLITQLPKLLYRHYFVQVLADGGFSSCEFLVGLRQRRIPALVTCACTRTLVDGRQVKDLYGRGQQVQLKDLPIPVWVSWFHQKQPDGKFRKHFLLSTRPLSGAYMIRLGAKRWRIEAFFKTMKQHFGVENFAVRRLKAVLRWVFFSWLAYLLSHWLVLAQGNAALPEWRAAARQVVEIFFTTLLLW